MKKVLITGTRSGLGKYLHDRFGGTAINRQTGQREWDDILRQTFDLVIHCAASAPHAAVFTQLPLLFDDNVSLTRKVLQCRRSFFVYISTAWVYSPELVKHSENEIILPEKAINLYTLTKMISESIIQQGSEPTLILRPCSLIGKESRPNNLMRLILEQNPRLTLTADSRYNLVLYQDIADFIEFAFMRRLTGIYNVAALDCITLGEIEGMTGHKPIYGNYHYGIGDIDNTRVAEVCPVFKQTSREILERFLKTL